MGVFKLMEKKDCTNIQALLKGRQNLMEVHEFRYVSVERQEQWSKFTNITFDKIAMWN